MLSKEDKILIKMLQQEKRYEELLAAINVGHSQHCEAYTVEDGDTATVIRQVNLAAEEN